MSTKTLIWTAAAVVVGMLVYKMVVEKYILKSGFEGEINAFDSTDEFLESNLKVA